jgi:hypothetical protein
MRELTKITVNGREYDSIEQMPPDVLQDYLQAMETMREGKASDASTGTIISESIIYNGQEYKSRDELPPEARALLTQMPEPSATTKTTNVEIKTIKTFHPRVSISEKFVEERHEKDPCVAWLWVKILSVVIIILLILLALNISVGNAATSGVCRDFVTFKFLTAVRIGWKLALHLR